ncbi:MFS transporter [Paenirhodobacter populi]|nr:MFS transporter [Sinirhodobacter populi]
MAERKDPGGPGWRARLGLMTLLQLVSTIAILALTVIAPVSQGAIGVTPQAVGYLVSLAYVFATLTSLIAGSVIAWAGAGRTIVAQVALITIAMLLTMLGGLPALCLAALCVGSAYGVNNSAASVVMRGHMPKGRQALAYSIKQAGVPLGAFCASVGLSMLALAGLPWRVGPGLIILVGLGFLIAFLQRFPNPAPGRPIPARHVLARLLREQRRVLRRPDTRALAIIGMLYTSAQLTVTSYALLVLLDEGWPLALAAVLAGTLQLGGAAGRIFWGHLADRLGIFAVLGWLGLVSAALMAVMASGLPGGVKAVAIVALGFHVSGWNGVYIAACSQTAPKGCAAGHTGALAAYTMAGIIFGPSLFALINGRLGDSATTFAMAGLAPLAGSLIGARSHLAGYLRAPSRSKGAVSARG